jgi:hypothetical protein
MSYESLILKTDKDLHIFANRSAIIIEHKEPFLDFVNKLFPEYVGDESGIDNAPPVIKLIQLKKNETQKNWLKKNYKELFRIELWDWVDETDYPKINYSNFEKYFKITFANLVVDWEAGKPIEMI